MEITTKIKENWLTRKVSKEALPTTLFSMTLLMIATFIYLNDFLRDQSWMSANYNQVMLKHEYWRLWTTLFAHGDLVHLGSNLLLYFPFAYYLSGHFGKFLFPLLGFLIGGLTNLIVLQTMPHDHYLIGVSGVVHWMGAVWMVLGFFIDKRQSLGKRLLKAIGVSIMLFMPDTLKPNVSYLSHFVGFVLGVLCAAIYYFFNRTKFKRAEVLEYIIEPELSEFDYSETKTALVVNE